MSSGCFLIIFGFRFGDGMILSEGVVMSVNFLLMRVVVGRV